jgi:transposase
MRKRPSRKPLPEHLPRERVIVPGPIACSCCGGSRLVLLAMVRFEKFGQHQPLKRQAERDAKEGVPISLSTLAD